MYGPHSTDRHSIIKIPTIRKDYGFICIFFYILFNIDLSMKFYYLTTFDIISHKIILNYFQRFSIYDKSSFLVY
jgi:hypothetical protein